MHPLMYKTLVNYGAVLYNFDKPKLDSPKPPSINPNETCFGSYCMRATVEKLNRSGEVHRVYKGYSQDMDIPTDVSLACERRRQEGETCLPAKLVFLKEVPNCNGIISEFDKDDMLINIVRSEKN